MIDYKILNNKGYKYVVVIINKLSKYLLCLPLKKNCETKTNESSVILETSLDKIESDRGADFYNIAYQNFLKAKIIKHCFRLTDKAPSVVERIVRTIPNFLKKPVFEKRNAGWISELSSVTKKDKNTNHSSTKLTPNQASKKIIEKIVYKKLKGNREIEKPKFNLGQLVRAADT